MSSDNILKNEKIKLVSHKDEWTDKFFREKQLLSEVIKGHYRQIEHIGSTSINGLVAKPIIDIAILIDNLIKIPLMVEILSKLQYSYHGEYGLPGRHFFIKGTPREFHLHIVDSNTKHWEKWIAFRDILKQDETMRKRYQDLKYKLLKKYQFDREKFTKGKSDFIDFVLADKI